MSMYNGLPVMAVALRKGGVGKTLFSVLLAQYLGHVSKTPRRVLLIDLDTQQNASESLLDMGESSSVSGEYKIPPTHPDYDENDPDTEGWNGISSSADIFYGDDPIIAPYPTRFDNLEILPAVGSALQAVEMVRSDEVKEMIYERLKEFFNDPSVQESYDLIIIDTPPGKGAINRSVLRAVTHVLYPVVPEEKPMDGLRSMLQFERMERRYRDSPIEVLGIVPNMVKMGTKLHAENLEIMRNDPLIGGLMTDFYIGQRIAFPTIDKPGILPDTIWKFSNYPEAKKEAFQLCEFVENKLFPK
jgi:chromosome partitioning protein